MRHQNQEQGDIAQRLATRNWDAVTSAVDTQGFAVLEQVLTPTECATLAADYTRAELFRSRIVMARHGFGSGEYQYFAYPLPNSVADLRRELYARLFPLANHWQEKLGEEQRYPEQHAAYIERCHNAAQIRPTPLLLRYGPGDYNCLHQDLYGEHVFPLQAAILLSQPGRDFSGGELVLTEQRPRMQSRAHVVPLQQGDAAIFAVHHRPVRGTRGYYRTHLRHGVSTLHTGNRYTLGVIFHDAS